jgi:threonine dehydrogenase-like Zn-dependent dehydrogenase
VPTYFPGALGVLRDNKDIFAQFIEQKIDFAQAEEYYALFEKNKVGKTVFVLGDESPRVKRAL